MLYPTARILESEISTAGMGDFPKSKNGKGNPYANRQSSPPKMLNALLEDVPLERPACAPALDDPDAGTWWIAFTKSNRHYDFITLADRAGIEFFLPMAERVTQTREGKRRISSYPLFGAYAFIRGTIYMPADALATKMLRQIIPVVDQDRLRRDLANLEKAMSGPNGRRMERCDIAVVGKRVRVADGPFEGVCGTVAGHRGNSELLLIQVEGMMGGAVMEIDAGKLEPAD
jgi:transcription antitermination factor NusG